MPFQNRIVKPGRSGTVVTDAGEVLTPPADWALLAPGDAILTKRVKSKGTTWLVQVKVGRRLISRGIWGNKEHIAAAAKEVAAMRATPEYEKKRVLQRLRREKKQQEYVELFCREVAGFLDFNPRYSSVAEKIAHMVTAFATPIGSGTVARTGRIPLPERARAAVIAWMRHQTTHYDKMTIERVKGRRREVRRHLAAASMAVLSPYRQGDDIASDCPLQKAFATRKME